MKLSKLIKIINPIGDMVIWTQEDDEESGPTFEGSILDIPWWMLDCKIGRIDGDGEEPIFLSYCTNKYGVKNPCLVVNIII